MNIDELGRELKGFQIEVTERLTRIETVLEEALMHEEERNQGMVERIEKNETDIDKINKKVYAFSGGAAVIAMLLGFLKTFLIAIFTGR